MIPIFKIKNFPVSYSRQVLAQPSMKICLSHAQCPMPHAHFPVKS
ncbi:hypothetical protein FDUTEX481_05128 [Tolypothrix sp. PCC 7601]|nr:hypothetical protein FDUTEX481_05128 [Tolypothrix sp. PCC 7601]